MYIVGSRWAEDLLTDESLPIARVWLNHWIGKATGLVDGAWLNHWNCRSWSGIERLQVKAGTFSSMLPCTREVFMVIGISMGMSQIRIKGCGIGRC